VEETVTQLPTADEQESDYEKAVSMQRKELLGLWGRGVINPPAYVYAALKLDGYFLVDDGNARSFDIGSFCLRWSADESFTVKGKRPKPLSHKQAIGALATIEEKGLGTMPSFGTNLKIHGA
jgi:hypothetical protein